MVSVTYYLCYTVLFSMFIIFLSPVKSSVKRGKSFCKWLKSREECVRDYLSVHCAPAESVIVIDWSRDKVE